MRYQNTIFVSCLWYTYLVILRFFHMPKHIDHIVEYIIFTFVGDVVLAICVYLVVESVNCQSYENMSLRVIFLESVPVYHHLFQKKKILFDLLFNRSITTIGENPRWQTTALASTASTAIRYLG